MTRLLCLLAIFWTALPELKAQGRVHLILCGGPALRAWEDLRVPKDQHDRWWANFVRASTLRMEELRKAYGDYDRIVWMVYRPGYVTRGQEDGKPYIQWIGEQASKRSVELIWLNSSKDFFRSFSKLPKGSVVNFDFFGHSNKHCWLLDYSNDIMASSKSWIHETELHRLKSSVLNRNAVCQSYGCHTGESMSSYFKQATGVPLIGAKGKTDYTVLSQNKLPVTTGSWVR